MDTLARYMMQGRLQAVGTMLVLGLVPIANLLSPAFSGLVLLQRGARDGLFVLAWAALPLTGWAMLGDMEPLLLLLGVVPLALYLRETGSWPTVLVVAAVGGMGMGLLLRLQPELLQPLVASTLTVLDAYQEAGGGEVLDLSPQRLALVLPGTLAATLMAASVGLLMIARWMQGALYNPGGFRQEFHRLRLGRPIALGSFGLLVLAEYMDEMAQAVPLYIPLCVAAAAVVHGLLARLRITGPPAVATLAVFYLTMLLAPWAAAVLTLIDNWYDFRKRMTQ